MDTHNSGSGKGRKVAIATLGCKVNQYESSSLTEMFKARGYEVVDYKEKADVYIINTCTVTHLGDRKSRQLIRRAAKTNPEGLIVVTGCYPQAAPGEVLGIPGVDLVTGTGDRMKLVDLVEDLQKGSKVNAVRDSNLYTQYEELPVVASTERVRAYLKIQEGCDNFCSYCIVPYTRGPLKSRNPENILEEAEKLVASGYRELVLTGIHTGAYGKDRKDGLSLSSLLEKISQIKGLARLRLSSVEPMDITDDLISLLARGAPFCPHLHIPIQSGDDKILKAMNRGYQSGDIRALVYKLRDKIRDLSISTDVIVGFPGENEEQFLNTYNLINDLKFSFLHVFKYSPRKGTPAAMYRGQVPSEIKDKRSNLLISLGKRLFSDFSNQYLGRDVEVLVEDRFPKKPGMVRGHTLNYLPVAFPGEDDLRGRILKVRVSGLDEDILFGRIIQGN